jgi:hypothetical protein
MATNTVNDTVDSYHINVGLGDAAIHVRKWNDATTGVFQYSAVLVDGGTTIPFAYENIKATMLAIEASMSLGEGNLQFKAVVITHWDHDHWGGISTLLKKEFNGKPGFKRFLYGTNPPDYGTTFYAPEVGSEGVIKIGLTKDETRGVMSCDGVELAHARWGKGLLGMDFFEGREPATVKNGGIGNLEDLLGPSNERLPVGMYCLAVNQCYVGNFSDPKTGFPKVGKSDKAGQLLQTMHDDKNTTKTNKSSIATIIAWDNGRVSHYFAGDIHAMTECWITDWLEKTTKKITCMKASHHGARTSNPPIMLQTFKPDHIVISALDQHGHPGIASFHRSVYTW